MKPLIHAAMLLALLVVVSGCEDKKAKEAMQSAKDAGGSLADMFAKGKDAVIASAKEKAAGFDGAIAEFKEAAGKQSGEAKEKLEASIKRLEELRASLKQKLEPLANAQGEGWKEITKEYDDVVTQMRKLIDEVRAGLKK